MWPFVAAGGLGVALVGLLVCLPSGKSPARRGKSSAARRAAGSQPRAIEDGTVRRLVERVNDKDEPERDRVAAAEALAKLGPRAGDAVPALVGILAQKHPPILLERAADKALRAIGRDAAPELVALLKAGKVATRLGATKALETIGPAATAAVEPLIKAMETDDDYGVRIGAARALGAIGAGAAAALPALRKAASRRHAASENIRVRELREVAKRAIEEGIK